MKTIAIANQKGGCGKTTTAINVSASLAADGIRVLLIDLDPQAHASFALRSNDQPADNSVYNVLTDNPERRRSLDSCIVSLSPNFHILPSNIQVSTLEQELKEREGAASELYRMLSSCESRYDYVIIDCPPSLGFLTFNALRAADWVIVPIDMSPFTLMGVGKLLGMIQLVETKIGHVPRVSALATLFDKRTTYSQEILDEIRSFFKDRMFQTIIRHNVALKRAVSKGVSIIDFDTTSTGAKDYTALSHEILRLDEVKDLEAPGESPVSVEILEKRQTALPTQEQYEESFEPEVQQVTFTIEAPTAQDVYVVGHFNEWKVSDESRLTPREDGCWGRRVELVPGTYRYQFVVDGEWTVDPKNEERERNMFGTFDSILRVTPTEVSAH